MFEELEKIWLEKLLEVKISELEAIENKGEEIFNDLEVLNSVLEKIKI